MLAIWRMLPPWARATARITAGVVLIIIGIIGAFVPIMPTWIFVIPGLAMIGDYFPPARRLHLYVVKKAEQGTDWAKEKAGWSKRKDNDSERRQ